MDEMMCFSAVERDAILVDEHGVKKSVGQTVSRFKSETDYTD